MGSPADTSVSSSGQVPLEEPISKMGTQFSERAQEELEKRTFDFEKMLHVRAKERAEHMDEVQRIHVVEAHQELLATRVDGFAELSVTVILPLGFTLFGVVFNDLRAYWLDQVALSHFSLIFALASGALITLGLMTYLGRYPIKRYFAKRRRADAPRHDKAGAVADKE